MSARTERQSVFAASTGARGTLSPERLRDVGEALRGPCWQRALAHDLDRDEREIRHWAAGTRTMPDTLADTLADMAEAHASKLMRLARSLRRD